MTHSQSTSAPANPGRASLVTMWKLGGLSLTELAMRTIAGYRKNEFDARGAQFAYYSMFALAPLLILLIASFAWLPLEGVLESFLLAVKAVLPLSAEELITHQIADIQQHSTIGLMLTALVLTSLAGARIFLTLESGLDAAHGVEEHRHFLHSGIMALTLTFTVFLLSLLAVVLLVIGPLAGSFLLGRFHLPWLDLLLSAGVRWGVGCGFMLVATSVIYWRVPSFRARWYVLSPGSLFATCGLILVMLGMQLYFEYIARARYNETFGTLGGVVVLLFWLYTTGTLLLTGGQINAVIQQAARRTPGD